MSKVNSAENTLLFKPFLMEHEAVREKKKLSFMPLFKFALLACDVVSALGGFALGVWLTGWRALAIEDFGTGIGLFILSLTVIAFFPTNHLYNYHFLFTRKKHLLNLGKSFCWSILTVGIIVFLYNSSRLLEVHFLGFITSLSLGAVALLFLSRFLWSHLLDFLKAIGMAFLFVGISGLFLKQDITAVLANNLTISFCFLSTFVLLTLNRTFLFHVVFNKWLRRHFRRQVVIVGSVQQGDIIARHIVDHNAPLWVVGTVGRQITKGVKSSLGKGQLGDLKKLPSIVTQFKIDDIIITDNNIDKQTLVSLLDFCTKAKINAWFPPKLMPIIDLKLYIDNYCGLSMIRLCSQKNTWLFNKIKHGLDALIAFPLLVLNLVPFLLIALAIKLESHGPVFYRATAVGKNGRHFPMYKFRTMKTDTSSDEHKKFVTQLIKGEIVNDDDGNKPLKMTDDPRITRVGKFLRKLSLDELPQLINVVKGDMSLVGPRPCLPYEYEVYQEWYKRRASVRAGITGLWQVTGRSSVSFEDMILLDLYYIYNRSLSLDLNILFETIFVVLGRKGAY